MFTEIRTYIETCTYTGRLVQPHSACSRVSISHTGSNWHLLSTSYQCYFTLCITWLQYLASIQTKKQTNNVKNVTNRNTQSEQSDCHVW